MKSKKAMAGIAKLGAIILLFIAIALVLFGNDLTFFGKSAVYETTKKNCEFSQDTILGNSDPACSPKNCDIEQCSEEESNRWDALSSSFEKTSCFKDEEKCETDFEERMYSMVVEGESSAFLSSPVNFEELEEISDVNIRQGFSVQDLENRLDSLPPYVKESYDKLETIEIEYQGESISAKDFLLVQSQENNMDPMLPILVLVRESRGDPNAISYTGCVGLFQFCYSTAYEDYANVFGTQGEKCTNQDKDTCEGDSRFNPKLSIIAGVDYVAKLSNRYDGNVVLTLVAYNAGSSISDACKGEKDEDLLSCIVQEVNERYKPSKVKEVEGYISEIAQNYQTSTSQIS